MRKGAKCVSSSSFQKIAATAQSHSPSTTVRGGTSGGGNLKQRRVLDASGDRNQQSKKISNDAAKVKCPLVPTTSGSSCSVEAQPQQTSATDIDIAYPFRDTKISVATFIDEWNKKVVQRQEFHDLNRNVEYGEFETLVVGKQLDSNLKKCTAFVRKIKLYLETQKSSASLESELNTLNLSKYVSEITAIILEIKFKYGDIPNALHACAELHKRYKDFSKHLMEKLISMKPTKALITNVSTLAKVSTDLRLLAELLLAGILPQDSGCHLLLKRIGDLVSLDPQATLLISTLAALLRGLSDDLVGTLPKDVAVALKEKESLLHYSNIIPPKLKKEIRAILRKYFNLVKTNLIQKNQVIMGSEKYNRKLRDTKGEIPEERQLSHMELVVSFEKYHSSAVKLAYLLDCSMPKLRQLPPDPEDEFERALLMSEDGVMLDQVPGIVLFEDEETRQFYQDLPDLANHLLQLKTVSNSKPVAPAAGDVHTDQLVSDDSETESEQSDDESDFDMEKESAELASGNMPLSFQLEPTNNVLPSTLGKRSEYVEEDEQPPFARLHFPTYLANLQNCVNKTMIDKAAYDFVENFNTKSCKEKLVRHVFLVSRNRMDLVRLYSRLIASLSQLYSKMGSDLCEMLRKDFVFLVAKRDQTKIDSKLKIVRFIAELTNFSVYPKSKAFYCLKLLLRSFANHQIWMACAFLDTCGKFLYKHYDSHRRMKLYLAEMLRRKSGKYLESRYITMIESSYYQICPPAGGTLRRKQKSPLQAFFELYLCRELAGLHSIKMARAVLKKLNWNDEGQFNLVLKIVTSPWNYNYSQLDTLAALIQCVQQFRPRLAQAVVEEISEGIRLGCECECEEMNNLRMSTCQYFAFLYNYKLVPSSALLNVLYYLISYGITYTPHQFSIMDPPDSLYRIRLICEMLRISHSYLSTKYSQRLHFFLHYFQRYFVYKKGLSVWTRWNKFPVYVQEAFEDTVRRLKKDWVFAPSMEQVEKEIETLESSLKQSVSTKQLKRVIENETQCVRIPLPLLKKQKLKANFAQITSASILEKSRGNAKNTKSAYSKGCEQSKSKLGQSMKYVTNGLGMVMEEDDDFEQAFELMCSGSESTASGGAAAWPKSDIPFAKAAVLNGGMDELHYGLPTVKVTLLTKGKDKPKAKTLVIKQDEDFLVNIKRRENADKMEKEEVKHRTLELATMQQKEEQKERERELQRIIQRICLIPKHK